MSVIDWIILAVFAPLLLLPAFASTKKHRANATERFAAGRRIPWLILGGSLAATTLSTDTPLLISGAFYENGIAGNWFWLAGVPGTMATLFFFARFWSRSGVLTKLEILSLRYGDGAPTTWLRATTAVFDAGLVNVLILSSVTYATYILIDKFLGFSSDPIIRLGAVSISEASMLTIGVMVVTVGYTLAAGFRAVVRTDLAQLGAAIVASTFVAFLALRESIERYGDYSGVLNAIPDADDLFNLFRADDPAIWLLLIFGWWQTAPGSGLFVQRLVSAKSESDATLTALFFAFVHYVVRVWPWFMIGAVALLYFPALSDSEHAYALVAEQFLPIGGVGLMVVAFWSAFMSTVDSHLNWGASYFVNDVYGAFGRNRDDRNARRIEALVIIGLSATALVIALTGLMTSIIGVYKYLIIIQSGAAFAAIARWYWWRLTIWSEIAALGSSLVVGNILVLIFDTSTNTGFALVVAFNCIACGLLTIATAVATSRKGPTQACLAFNKKVGAGGPGWRALDPDDAQPRSNGLMRQAFAMWLLSIILIYGCISLIAAMITMNGPMIALAGVVVVAASACFWRLKPSLKRVLDFRPVA